MLRGSPWLWMQGCRRQRHAVLVIRGFFKLCLWEVSTEDIGQA